MMREYRYRITGDPVTKKNSGTIVTNGKGGHWLRPSKQFLDYEEMAIRQLRPQLITNDQRRPIDTPVEVTCIYYMRTRRRVDIANLLNGTHDILQDAGILEDDCRDIIASVDGSRVHYDPQDPHVDIIIRDYTDPDYYNFKRAVEADKKAPHRDLTTQLYELGVMDDGKTHFLEVELL